MVLSDQSIIFIHGFIMIERIHLAIVCEIERQGSLTAAASALHLTQSAVSHTMKKLESRIGTPLWVKDGRRLQFTQAGLYLLAEAKRLQPQLKHVDEILTQYAQGERGSLRIGMECHPCYQWLLNTIPTFIESWPHVDVDVRQKFQFGGMAALFNYEIDILVTPDPIHRPDITFIPIFPYEQVLVTGKEHRLANKTFITPNDLIDEYLYTYPVPVERLDIYKDFLLPAECLPKKRKTIEATEMMLHMVVAHRGVATLPLWLVEQYKQTFALAAVKLGKDGIKKQIFVGTRENETNNSLLQAFLAAAKTSATA